MHKLIECKTGWRAVRFDKDIIADCANSGIEVLEHDCNWNDPSCADYDYAAVQRMAKSCGIYMQSVHLALGDTLDISYEPTKAYALDVLTRQLENAAKADVKYAVLHASAEPIGDNERKMRMDIAADSVLRLCKIARNCGITLCLEDLPRSCLCNDISELESMLSLDSSLRVCFDVNHLLKCTHEQFMQAFGSKIVKGCMSGLKPAVVGLIGASVISVGAAVFLPNGFDASMFYDFQFPYGSPQHTPENDVFTLFSGFSFIVKIHFVLCLFFI